MTEKLLDSYDYLDPKHGTVYERFSVLEDEENDRIPNEHDITEMLSDYARLLWETDQKEKSQAVMNLWANLETWGMRK